MDNKKRLALEQKREGSMMINEGKKVPPYMFLEILIIFLFAVFAEFIPLTV